jgi:hypothetical protein
VDPTNQGLTIKEVCDAFEADAKPRDLRKPTLYKNRLLFRR